MSREQFPDSSSMHHHSPATFQIKQQLPQHLSSRPVCMDQNVGTMCQRRVHRPTSKHVFLVATMSRCLAAPHNCHETLPAAQDKSTPIQRTNEARRDGESSMTRWNERQPQISRFSNESGPPGSGRYGCRTVETLMRIRHMYETLPAS